MRRSNMKDRSLNLVGGICAIIIGVITTTTSLTYLLVLPPEQRAGVLAPQILPSLAKDPTPLLLVLWQMVATGVLGLALVPALSKWVRTESEGWVRWAANLGTLGFAVSAVSNALSARRLPGIANAFVAGDASTKAALVPVWRSSLDFEGLWQFGAIGFWIFVVSFLFLRGNQVARSLAYVGLALGVVHWLAPLGLFMRNQTIIILAVGLAAILGPIWYIWIGLVMRRRAVQE
jgi:hypothetical protein